MTGRYEEEFYGQTSIGYPSQSYRDLQLGSGFMFPDEQTKVKEWAINSSRIEGWRRTRSYRYWREVGGVFAARQATTRPSFAEFAFSCSGLQRLDRVALRYSQYGYPTPDLAPP